jgi:hypothetical protein
MKNPQGRPVPQLRGHQLAEVDGDDKLCHITYIGGGLVYR